MEGGQIHGDEGLRTSEDLVFNGASFFWGKMTWAGNPFRRPLTHSWPHTSGMQEADELQPRSVLTLVSLVLHLAALIKINSSLRTMQTTLCP